MTVPEPPTQIAAAVISAEPSIYLTVPSSKIWIHRNRRWLWPTGIGLTVVVLALVLWCALR